MDCGFIEFQNLGLQSPTGSQQLNSSRRLETGSNSNSVTSQLKSRQGSTCAVSSGSNRRATTSSQEEFSRTASASLSNAHVHQQHNQQQVYPQTNGSSSIINNCNHFNSIASTTPGQQQSQAFVSNSNNSSGLTNATVISKLQSQQTSASNTMLPSSYEHNQLTMRRTSIVDQRGNRRMGRQEDGFTCSHQSILSAMDKFVKAVSNMSATVLVPSKLRDIDVPGPKTGRIPPALANTDLYSFYLMLNDVKKELLWGPGTGVAAAATLAPLLGSGRSTPREPSLKQHVRNPSDDSLGSLGSTASSSDPDTDSEVDSLMTDRDSVDEHTSHLAAAFRHHLQGLHTILHQLADSADYLSSRYQEDIDASSL